MLIIVLTMAVRRLTNSIFLSAIIALSSSCFSLAFISSTTTPIGRRSSSQIYATEQKEANILDSFLSKLTNNVSNTNGGRKKFRMAQNLISQLINEDKCFTTIDGAQKFADSCAINIVYEDCYEPQPIVGRAAVANHLKSRNAIVAVVVMVIIEILDFVLIRYQMDQQLVDSLGVGLPPTIS